MKSIVFCNLVDLLYSLSNAEISKRPQKRSGKQTMLSCFSAFVSQSTATFLIIAFNFAELGTFGIFLFFQ